MKKLSIILTAWALCAGVQAQLIDDFSGSLSPYTQTIVLAQNADGPLIFSINSGALQVGRVFSSGGAAQQDLFLRSDFSLGVGQILRISTALASDGTVSDFGLVVSALVNPPGAVWTSGTADARQDFINVYAKRQTGAIGYNGYNGTTQIASSSGVNVGGLTNVTGLFIDRTSLTSFDVGYTTASGDTILRNFNEPNTAVGTAIGFYADIRSTTTFGSLDNLRLEPVPEPGSLALFGLSGLLGLISWKRRRAP
jgi:hypothetical protein